MITRSVVTELSSTNSPVCHSDLPNMCFLYPIGNNAINSETRSVFSGGGYCGSGASSSSDTSEALIAKTSRLIAELKADPLAVTGRHSKRHIRP